MARNFYRIFTENNPVMGDSKTFGIPEAKGLTSKLQKFQLLIWFCPYADVMYEALYAQCFPSVL